MIYLATPRKTCPATLTKTCLATLPTSLLPFPSPPLKSPPKGMSIPSHWSPSNPRALSPLQGQQQQQQQQPQQQHSHQQDHPHRGDPATSDRPDPSHRAGCSGTSNYNPTA